MVERFQSGNKTYKVEVVQYDNQKGEGGRVIGEKTDGKINLIEALQNIDYGKEKLVDGYESESPLEKTIKFIELIIKKK